ncbi:MFS transporter [Microcoleus sp. FACHB-1515]|uniref:MFS transporter n=1 Tax=Cyanophyceae TaxID=3028117 RepID=UPI0016871F2E|nr:MFS transporter [Microcoleus sp. FACHB-1515]MBD2089278.1 MFS transporter [Microcoleus sp. FACHB-1515]
MTPRFEFDLENRLPRLSPAGAENGLSPSQPTPRKSDLPRSLPEPLTFPGGDMVEALEAISELVEEIAEEIAQPEGEDHPIEEFQAGFLPVLRNLNFLALWGGQVFSQLADKVYLVLMIMLIDNRFQTAGQPISGWVSSIMIAFTIPAVLFGSIAGVYVDHWPKKAVLVATNLLRGGLVLILPPLLWITQGWSPLGTLPIGFGMLLAITFLVSTLTQFFAPAEQAAIPLIVDRRHLLSANSLYTTTMMASVIIGFAVGEPLLAIADSLVAHLGGGLNIGKELLVGFSYAIAGIILIAMQTREKIDLAELAEQEPPKVWDNIRDGVRYLGEQGRVRAALIQLVILFSIFAALAVLAVRLAEVMPALKSSQFGFLLAAGGVGMAIGATLVGQFGQRFSRAQLALAGSIGMAGALGGMSIFTHQLWPTLGLLVVLGCCAAIVGVPMQTTIQEETPEEMRGKVFGLQNNAINIALSLPLALAGVAETFLGLRIVLLILATLTIAGGALTWTISREAQSKTVS